MELHGLVRFKVKPLFSLTTHYVHRLQSPGGGSRGVAGRPPEPNGQLRHQQQRLLRRAQTTFDRHIVTSCHPYCCRRPWLISVGSLPTPWTLLAEQGGPYVKNDLSKLVRWFCRHLTYNDLASVVPVLQEVLSGSRKMELKSAEDRPPHYRQFRVDPTLPLLLPPRPKSEVPDWHELQRQHEEKFAKPISIVRRRSAASAPPEKCHCQHCNAPARYLYLNNGKLGSQVLC